MYFLLAFIFSFSLNAGANCEIKPAVVCNSVNAELSTAAKKYEAAVKNLANTVATIPNIQIPHKFDLKSATEIVKKIDSVVSNCSEDTIKVSAIIADLKKIEADIRNMDETLQKVTTSDNAALSKAREEAINNSNSLLALLLRMNENNAVKIKTLCKQESADEEENDDDDSDSDSENDDADSKKTDSADDAEPDSAEDESEEDADSSDDEKQNSEEDADSSDDEENSDEEDA